MRRNTIGLWTLVIMYAASACQNTALCNDAVRLDEVLNRAHRWVELSWQQVGSYFCTEEVVQEKIGKKNKVEYKINSAFDYLALPREQQGSLAVEEMRLPKKKVPDKPNQPPLLATHGFPTLPLVFHPKYRSNYRYQFEPGCDSDERMVCIRFEHIEGTPSSCALQLQDRIHPLELHGTAWIDRESGAIRKMTANLAAPLKELNIEALNIEVTYASRPFPPDPELKLLPELAVIQLTTARQHWRNRHRYSQYKRFTVESQESNP